MAYPLENIQYAAEKEDMKLTLNSGITVNLLGKFCN